MPLVQAKCTNCGANLEVDNAKDAAVCQYCNSAFIVEKAINNYTTYITNNNNFAGANINILGIDAENYIKLASNALKVGNGQEAYNYAKKALEAQPESSAAWIAKMRSLEYFNTSLGEVINCGSNAIKYAPTAQKYNFEAIVYSYYLARAITIMSSALSKIKETEGLRKEFMTAAFSNSEAVFKVFYDEECEKVSRYFDLTGQAIKLKLEISEAYFISNAKARQDVVRLANLYIDFCEASNDRIAILNRRYDDSAFHAREEQLGLLTNSLSDSEKAQVRSEAIRPTSVKKGGCYVATAVYGSYDCPQVWTLRRFRDSTLAETWYGRAFVHTYYAISPTLVKWFGHTEWFKKMWRNKLDKIVSKLQKQGVENTPYQDRNW